MPEVILLKDVENVGERGAVVDVSKGYFRNYLAPRKLAQPATKGALEAVRRSHEAAEKAQEQSVADARTAAEQLDRTVLTIEQQAGEDGRLFGSVTNQDIADAVQFLGGPRDDAPGGQQASGGFAPRADIPVDTSDYAAAPAGGNGGASPAPAEDDIPF